MNKFLQIACYLVSFLFFLAIGNFFEFITDDYIRTLKDELPGKPLPIPTAFFTSNHLAISYIFLFPWLAFVGLPLFPFIRESYWDANFFLLRFSVFLPLELLLLFFFFFSYCIPFVGICGCMSTSGEGPPLTWFEFSMRCLFWLSALLLLMALVMRVWRNRKSQSLSQ